MRESGPTMKLVLFFTLQLGLRTFNESHSLPLMFLPFARARHVFQLLYHARSGESLFLYKLLDDRADQAEVRGLGPLEFASSKTCLDHGAFD